jgi:small subunit ribosomal protein S11
MARQQTGKKSGAKKQKRNVPNGVGYIQSTFNNTIVTITDLNGEVISWASAGSSGFKELKRGLPLQLKQQPKVLPAEPTTKECAK